MQKSKQPKIPRSIELFAIGRDSTKAVAEGFLNPNICIYIYSSMSKLPKLPCLCATLRRTTRALTQLYDDAIHQQDLSLTQLTILQVFSRAGEVSQGRLAEILAMDSTTLTRTLKLMTMQGWIAVRRGADRRERLLSLSKSGEAKLTRATPAWDRLQSRLRHQLGDQTWNSLMLFNNQLADLVTKGDEL
jgi:DNA-binding MarR family transcriptional regulator